jgi:hypothetical protein
VPIVFKSGSLKLLEPSGPVQACNGIASPFYFKKRNINFMQEKITLFCFLLLLLLIIINVVVSGRDLFKT